MCQLTQYGLAGAEDFCSIIFALAKELHFTLLSWKNGRKTSMQMYNFS